MKKIIFLLLVSGALAACGGSGTENKPAGEDKPAAGTEEKKEPANDLSGNPDYQKGLALVGKSDCFTCHKIDEPLTGPSYNDVAAKYAGASDATIKELADRIIKGGNGVWGEVFMTPHPSIPEEDAKAMVKYILLLKK